MLRLKIPAGRLCAFVALLWAGSVSAQPSAARVLVLDSPASPRPGLVAALRIQLVDAAVVDTEPSLPEGSVSKRIAAATAAGEAHGSTLVVWSDEPMTHPDGSSEAVLYAVARSDGRALLQVVRVPGGSGPEVDRALALKIGELLRELQRARADAAEAAQLQLEAPAAIDAAVAAWQWSPELVVGAVVGPQAGTDLGQWGVLVGGGVSVSSAALRLGARVQLAWFPELAAVRGGDEVQLSQLSPELLVRSQWRQGPVWLGGHVGLGAALVGVEANSATGASARADADSLTWLMGVDCDVELTRALWLGVGVGLEARMTAQRLTIQGREITALEAARPRALLSLRVFP